MAINVTQNKDSILEAWRNVIDDKTNTNWAIFGYEGLTNVMTLISQGDDGIDEMKEELNSSKIMYAFCKVLDPKTSLNKYVLINWQGEGAPLLRKGVCANHIRDVSNILRGAHVTMNARTEEEVDEDLIIDKVSKSTASNYSFDERLDLSKDGYQKLSPSYKKVEPKNEINPSERDKFWAIEEEKEKKRQLEEINKKKEQCLKLEQERLRRETEDAKKRELLETINTNNAEKHDNIIEHTPLVDINKKIEEIVKVNNNVDVIREQRKKETQKLISQRTANISAIFEKNTSAGQIISTRKHSSSSLADVNDTFPSSTKEENIVVSNGTINEIITSSIHNDKKIEAQSETIIKDNNSQINDSNLGEKAIALYDYQAADETEISFDPDDIITNIEQIDPGWWQGLGPDGSFGLFPSNYVQIIP